MTSPAAKTRNPRRPVGPAARRPTLDSLENMVTSLGGLGSKVAQSSYSHAFIPKDRGTLDAVYRDSWLARKVIDIPAHDAIRSWREWEGDEDAVEAVEAEERRLNLLTRVMDALVLARLHGGAILIFHVRGQDPASPLVPESVGQGDFMFARAMGRYDVNPRDKVLDFESELFGMPEWYDIDSRDGGLISVHASRVARFVPRPRPHTERDGDWGDSILDAFMDAHNQAVSSSQAASLILQEALVDVVKMPDFTASIMGSEYREAVLKRFQLLNQAKGLTRTLVLDEKDEWARVQTSNIQAVSEMVRTFMLLASGAADIPATRLLGQSPSGMSATGESDLRNYYDAVAAYQRTVLSPALVRLDDALVRSATGGEADDALRHEWRPLWQLSDQERADRDLKAAQAFNVDASSGLFNEDVLRLARASQLLEHGTYPGLREAMEDNDLEPEEVDPAIDEEDAEADGQFAAARRAREGARANGAAR